MGWEKTHICDRCKKEYKERVYRESVVKISKRTCVNVVFGFSAQETNDRWGHSYDYDLCYDCRKALYKFLKGEDV